MKPPIKKPAKRAFLCLTLAAVMGWPGLAAAADTLLELNGRFLPEASGLAQSQRDPGRLWMLNDSGNPARLYALDVDLQRYTALDVSGGENRDWEDLESFTIDGEPWLAIGDIGDNFSRRSSLQVYLIPEPEDLSSRSVEVFATLALRYPDGPRDAESLAVDSATGTLYVLSKRDAQPRLYSVRLPEVSRDQRLALELEFVGEVGSIPPPTEAEIRASRYGRYRAQPTSMAFSPKHNFIALLTYGRAYIAPLSTERSWLKALNESLCPLERVELKQGETIAISTDGSVLVSSEGNNAPLYRIAPTCDA